MASSSKRTIRELANDKAQRIMDGVEAWTAYYRSNPHIFAKEYLNLNLKDFQKILLILMEFNILF